MGDKISFEGTFFGKKFDKDGKLLKEYNKKTEGIMDIKDIDKTKICIDANMITSAILKPDFKKLLTENKGNDMPFTTEEFKKESIGNLKKIKNITIEEAERLFEIFEKEIGLKYLEFKGEYYNGGINLFSEVMKSGIKIKKKSTFLMDCVNLITIKNNGVFILFSNDEDLEKVCKNFVKSIKVIRIQEDSDKVIKDFFRFQF